MERRMELKTERTVLFMTVLVLLQPLLDLLSFWQDQLGVGNSVTLFLRAALLFGVAAAGFFTAEKKRPYLVLAGILLAFLTLHTIAVLQVDAQTLPSDGEAVGLPALLADWSNFLRVVQIPIFTLCFITFLKRTGEAGFGAIERAFFIVLVFIAVIEVLSVLTGTNPYTYPNKELGVLGWFYFANAQSAVLSILVPVSLMWVIRRTNGWRVIPACVLGFGILYFFGTRLTFAAILATAFGLAFTLLVTDRKRIGTTLLLCLCAVICIGAVTKSPMYENQKRVAANAELKQELIDTLISGDEAWARSYGLEGKTYENMRVLGAYHFYLGGLVEKYGIERVAEQYDYSTQVGEIANLRAAKRNFCTLMQEKVPPLSRLFGVELGDLRYRIWNYDSENDFHGIYVLYGIVGLVLFCAFILYFFYLIAAALLRNAKRYYTPEAGAWGVGLIMAMMHAFATAGILRRPNASFYLSVTLAVIYYLVCVRRYEARDL